MNLSTKMLTAASLAIVIGGCWKQQPDTPPTGASCNESQFVTERDPAKRAAAFEALLIQLQNNGLTASYVDTNGSVVMVPKSICGVPTKPSAESDARAALKKLKYTLDQCAPPPIVITTSCTNH